MKITKTLAINAFCIGTVIGVGLINRNYAKQATKDYRQKIQQVDTVRFNKTLKQAENMGIYKERSLLRDEFEKMSDSLRMDSIYKKGVQDGKRGLKDSLLKISKAI